MNAILILLFLSLGFSNSFGEDTRCIGRTSIVFVLPIGEQFSTLTVYLEDFLLQVVNYFEISKYDFRISMLEYSKSLRYQGDFLTTNKLVNTEISTIGTNIAASELNDGISLRPILVDAVQSFNTSEYFRKKIVILFLNQNVDDVDSSKDYVDQAKASGITFYVVTSFQGSVDAAMSLATDVCKAFIVDDYKTGMDDIISDLGNSICLASDPRLSITSGPDTLGNCNIGTNYQPPEIEFNHFCRDDGLFPDKTNCAYFYKCTNRRFRSVHLKCEPGNIFDANTQTCNHKMAVTCYTGIECPEETGLFPHPNDCYKFLNCYQGMTYIQECPYGLVFDKLVKRCLLPMHALC